jgi:hypothetical protein
MAPGPVTAATHATRPGAPPGYHGRGDPEHAHQALPGRGGGAGAQPARLVEVARQLIDLTATSYDGDCLTRPVFLEHAEFSVLRDDLLALHAALASLPAGCLAARWPRSPAPWG